MANSYFFIDSNGRTLPSAKCLVTTLILSIELPQSIFFWSKSCERYAKDKVEVNGSLIYPPPPLNEVWLDKRDQNNFAMHDFVSLKDIILSPTLPSY